MFVLVEQLLHFISHYGYAGLFLSMVLGIVGLPIPDETLMTFTGYLASKGTLLLASVIVVSFVGSVCGMMLSYTIGRKFGYPLLEKYGSKIKLDHTKLEKVKTWFAKRGKWAIPFGYFIPGVRHLTAYFAGIGRWRFTTFLLYTGLGAILWVVTFCVLGYVLGEQWRYFAFHVHHQVLFILRVISIGVIVYSIYRLVRSSVHGSEQK
jgi:membrane protein DedA with SNARE-associated domain